MEKNKNFISEVLNDLKNTSKYLKEAYIFNEEGDEEFGPGMEQPNPEAMMAQHAHHEEMEGDSAEEKAMHAQEVIQHEPIIGKIRETAIEGLKKYADNPTSKIYEFFKKVFLDSDKVLTDTGAGK